LIQPSSGLSVKDVLLDRNIKGASEDTLFIFKKCIKIEKCPAGTDIFKKNLFPEHFYKKNLNLHTQLGTHEACSIQLGLRLEPPVHSQWCGRSFRL
jgi:hypothetical protein